MSLFVTRCTEVRKAQLAFYAAADAAAEAEAAFKVAVAADPAADPASSNKAQDAYAAALHHFQTVRRAAEAQFPGLTMAEVHFAAGF